MEKDKNLKKLLYKQARSGPKLIIFAQTQISKLRTVKAHPIFTGSYKKKRVYEKQENF